MFTKKRVLIGGGGKTGISLKRIFSWIHQYFVCQSSDSDIGIQSLSLDFPTHPRYTQKYVGACAHTCTRTITNTTVFLVETARIVSRVRTYRMPKFRAFIALWPFDSRPSALSTVICFERVPEKGPFSFYSPGRIVSEISILSYEDYGLLFHGDTMFISLAIKRGNACWKNYSNSVSCIVNTIWLVFPKPSLSTLCYFLNWCKKIDVLKIKFCEQQFSR